MRDLLSFDSPLTVIWLWHALFDGTPLCNCQHSKGYKAIRRRNGVSAN